MADFHQNGLITTLHRLGDRPIEALETELRDFGKRRAMSLILPCLYSELEGDALPHIVDELSKVEYLDEIIIGLDAADEAQFAHAHACPCAYAQRKCITWARCRAR